MKTLVKVLVVNLLIVSLVAAVIFNKPIGRLALVDVAAHLTRVAPPEGQPVYADTTYYRITYLYQGVSHEGLFEAGPRDFFRLVGDWQDRIEPGPITVKVDPRQPDTCVIASGYSPAGEFAIFAWALGFLLFGNLIRLLMLSIRRVNRQGLWQRPITKNPRTLGYFQQASIMAGKNTSD